LLESNQVFGLLKLLSKVIQLRDTTKEQSPKAKGGFRSISSCANFVGDLSREVQLNPSVLAFQL